MKRSIISLVSLLVVVSFSGTYASNTDANYLNAADQAGGLNENYTSSSYENQVNEQNLLDADMAGGLDGRYTSKDYEELHDQGDASAIPTGLASPGYMLDPSMFSPSTRKYTGGATANTKTLLASVGKFLLITLTTLATVLIIIGGMFMVTSAGDSEKASRGKAIVSFNIMAIIIALFSYSIIQLVRWVLS